MKVSQLVKIKNGSEIIPNKIKQFPNWYFKGIFWCFCSKSNQGNQDSSGNQKIVIQGQRQDMKNRHTQQKA